MDQSEHLEEGYLQAERGELIDGKQPVGGVSEYEKIFGQRRRLLRVTIAARIELAPDNLIL